MSRRLLLCLLVTAGSIGLSARAPAQPAAEIKWRTDYNLARKEAMDKNLPLLLDFYTDKCVWCDEMDRTSFRDPKIIELVNEKFIPLKIHGGRETELVKTLNIEGFPTFVLAGPDGKVHKFLPGYQAAAAFKEQLQRVVSATIVPDHQQRDIQKDFLQVDKWIAAGNFPMAIPTLQRMIEENKTKAIQDKAQKLLGELEGKARERLAVAKQLQDKGQATEAIQKLSETIRDFPGLAASREATDLMSKLAQEKAPDHRTQQRMRRAQELLAQAREYYKNKEFILCMDRCEAITSTYGDLDEGQQAAVMVNEIKGNPEILQTACDTLSDRLSNMYLALADSFLKKGQRQQAMNHLQRVITCFPGTRQAESAQIRLSQLQGTPAIRPVELRPPGP